jgi:cysteinyl-tRNA synthetase
MATYEKGDRNADEVMLFQRAIGIAATGRYGPETVAAVKAWQLANGQEADGRVGPDMLLTLGLNDLLIVENGDEGRLVEAIQQVVSASVDGIYGDDTQRKVRAWQKSSRLKATGSADARTLAAMGLLEVRPPSPSTAPSPSSTIPPPAPRPTSVPSRRPASITAGRSAVTSWAYQLADIEPSVIASLQVDLAVIDYAADGSAETAFTPVDTAHMKQCPDGRTKKLIAYMSIGEAEDYRFYWQKGWNKAKTRPAWLDDLNPDWEGNYKVRYWDPRWQAIILGSPGAYLDRIIDAGFDGVYLDIVDAFEYWRDEKCSRMSADRDMIEFVSRIADYARDRHPDFMIIPQNGEALLQDADYRRIISAQAKEDIFYGQSGDGKLNDSADVAECLTHLALATADGIPILAIEYLKDTKKMADAEQRLQQAGCCAFFGPRALDRIATGQFDT